MIDAGTVTSVESRSVGSPLTTLAAAGSTTLWVNDNYDFSPGDEVLITIADSEDEPEPHTITAVDDATGIQLATPLAVDAPEGSWVAIVPLQFETVAQVRLVESGEVVPCIVLHTLADALRPGIRDESTAETVLIVQVGDDRYVFDVVARQTERDLTNAVPGLKPAQPDPPVLSTVAYLDEAKQLQSQITATWSPVLENEDGSPITDLDHYELQIRSGGVGDAGGAWQEVTRTPGDITVAYLRPYPPGSTWRLRLRAVDESGNASPWSDEAAITTATDDIPPPQPSRPVLTSRLGVVTITWDGKDNVGAPMPDDFAYVEVHLSTTSGFTATPDGPTKVDQIPAAGSIVWGPAAFGTTYYCRLIAVDTSGNASTQSLIGSTDVKPLVDVSNFPDDAMEVLYARTGHFIQLDADQVTSNSAAIGFLESGTIVGGIFQASAGGEFRTNASPASSGGIRIRDVDGFMAWANGGGTPTVTIDRTTGKLTARNAEITGTIKAGTTIEAGVSVTASSLQTGTSGARVVVSTGSAGRVDFYGSTSDSIGGYVQASSGGQMQIRPPVTPSASISPVISLLSTTIGGRLTLTGSSLITLDGPVSAPNGITGSLSGSVSGGTISGDLYTTAGTTADSINANVNGSTGRVRRSTAASSRAYKDNIQPLSYDLEQILAPAAVAFDYRPGVVDDDSGTGLMGLIFEDVEEAGLDPMLTSEGDRKALRYDRLPILHQHALRLLLERVVEVEASAAREHAARLELEARVEQLERLCGAQGA